MAGLWIQSSICTMGRKRNKTKYQDGWDVVEETQDSDDIPPLLMDLTYEIGGKTVQFSIIFGGGGPARLFRVQYDGNTSLTARTELGFRSELEFKTNVELHLDWYNSYPTPFVSTFSSRQHAENWANQRVNKGDRDVVILELDPRQLGPIFCVRHLVKHPRLQVDTKLPENMYRDEYLVLHEIREGSIMNHEIVHRDEYESSYESDESDPDDLAHYIDTLTL
ncbi:hypothetical protein GQ600_11210 [Phytophthora cactorum]|nr:hypothetical protein GQ600_11210 [Phytophthora cactorum]